MTVTQTMSRLLEATALSEAVSVVGWKQTQYTKEFWQELASRCAKEILGKEVPLKITFKKLPVGWGKAFHRPQKGKYEIELDPSWSVRMNAETTAHEIAHVKQFSSGVDLSDKDALEWDAVSYEPIGERVLKLMQKEGWKPRFEMPSTATLLGKKAADLSPDELTLLDKPIADMTPEELDRAIALRAKLKGKI